MVSALRAELEALLRRDPSAVAPAQRARFEAAAHGTRGIVIMGAGPLGRRVAAGLRRVGNPPLAFLDNSPAAQGTERDGLPILAPAAARERFPDALAVVAIYNPSKPLAQLRALGLHAVGYEALFAMYAGEFLPFGGLALPDPMFAEAERVRRAFDLWSDDASREEYVRQLEFRLTHDRERLAAPRAPALAYFDPELVALSKDETFVDCGAYDGDTLELLMARAGGFARYVALEPDPANFQKLQRRIAALPGDLPQRVAAKPFALGTTRGEVSFSSLGTGASSVGGEATVPCAPLDELLEGTSPTFIKMDIEGAEPEALKGGARTIAATTPLLAVCLYHQPEHLWSLPLLVSELSSGYRFHLRRYAEDCWELMLYAIPTSRAVRPAR